MLNFKNISLLILFITLSWPIIAAPTHTPNQITAWELSGAIAAKNKKKGWTAVVNWSQQGPEHYQMHLYGPLGGGSVIIEKHGALVTFRDGSKKGSSRNADELLQAKTGVRLPVKNLYYWIRGIPAPGAVQASQYDANHYLTAFKQAGYTITYPSYTLVNGIHLPNKIRLNGNGLLIKLVIKRWKIGL